MDIKERIKELCKKNGISMNALEKELGLGNGYMSKLGKSMPNSKYLQKIADRFNVTTDYIMTGEEPKFFKNCAILDVKITDNDALIRSLNETVAYNIRKYRTITDITLKELADKVGITEATMQKYEAGSIKSIATEMLIRIARALGVTPCQLAEWEGKKENISSELSKKYNLLTNEHQRVVNDLIESLLKSQSHLK